MRFPRIALALTLAAIAFPLASLAQAPDAKRAAPAPMAASAPTAVPALVPFAAMALDAEDKPLQPEAQINFLIFKDELGGEALWMETQSVEVDPTGHYKVQLGAANSQGLPIELFSTGEARWLEVQIAGQKPQPRILLASVPYALKAGDATTLGGLPVSAFALAGQKPAAAAGAIAAPDVNPTVTDVTTTGGTAGYIPEFSGASTVVDSPMFVSSAGEFGINELAPTATLDVNGTENVRGVLSLPALTTATAKAGQRSQLMQFSASAWDSTTSAAVSPTFKLLANFDGNDTASPSGDLEIHYQQGEYSTNILSIAGNGVITFAPAQTFPGTIASVTATSPLTAATLNGATTIGLSTFALDDMLNGVYARLAGANTFTAANTFNGNTVFSGGVTSSSSELGVPAALDGQGGSGVTGVSGTSDLGDGVSGSTDSGYGIYGNATGDGYAGFFTSGGAAPTIYATNTGTRTYAISSRVPANGSTALHGSAYGGYDDTEEVNSYGVYGNATLGTGVFGQSGADSKSFAGLVPYEYSAGMWGDTNVAGGGVIVGAVAGTADNNSAAYFYNKSADFASIVAYNEASGPTGLFKTLKASSPDGTCGIGGSGDLSCTGQLKSLVSSGDGARKLETYAMQSPENWMEDFGSGVLERGVAVVKIDPAFADTVSGDASYHVFITPNGDSKGLYVIRKTATTFEVRESGGGVSSLTFDYRIVAKRRGYESQRLTDVTEGFNAAMKDSDLHRKPAVSPLPRPDGIHHDALPRSVVVPSIQPAPARASR